MIFIGLLAVVLAFIAGMYMFMAIMNTTSITRSTLERYLDLFATRWPYRDNPELVSITLSLLAMVLITVMCVLCR